MNPTQRLVYHKDHSLPIMEEIRDWGLKHFKEETVEENSGLGKAIAYFNKNFDRLTLFCQIEGAKTDLATAMQADINVFDYFNAIQRQSKAVKMEALEWMPWNYEKHKRE